MSMDDNSNIKPKYWKYMKNQLNTYCELYWWNMSNKTLDYKGPIKGLLEKYNIKYTKQKTEIEGIFNYHFKSIYGITYNKRGTLDDFTLYAKQAIQMELVRMGDKSKLYVAGCWRPTVTVNF